MEDAYNRNDTYCSHAVDLIQSQLQQLLITTLCHQFECRLLVARLVLEQQSGYVSDTLERKRERGREGKDRCVDKWMKKGGGEIKAKMG